jgi:hypothetical protein
LRCADGMVTVYKLRKLVEIARAASSSYTKLVEITARCVSARDHARCVQNSTKPRYEATDEQGKLRVILFSRALCILNTRIIKT